MRILITGSEGFVGKRLVKFLKLSGYSTICLDLTLGYNLTKWDSLCDIPPFDYLFHLAASSFVPDSFENPRRFYENNISSTINILELCRQNDAKCVYTSSYVYGAPDYLPVDEKHPIRAHNPYAQSKIIGEELCKAYARDFDVPSIIIRPFNIYGPGQRSEFLIPSIIEQAHSGKVILNDPRPRRDYIYLDDVIQAYIACVHIDYKGSDIYNIGAGISISIHDVVDEIAEYFDNIDISFTGKRRQNEILDTVADITKIQKIFGWVPQISFKEGIKHCIEDI